jgi:DNA (cytosine-5)-methyltransferase 1
LGSARRGRQDHPDQEGFTFRRWCRQLQNLGYELDMWELQGCDYGAPTTRERLFIVARRDGLPIVKPSRRTARGLKPYRTAAECIDWNLACPSIFDRKKPLAENTLRRIAEGIRRFVINSPDPFIVPVSHAGDSRVHGSRRAAAHHHGQPARRLRRSAALHRWRRRPARAEPERRRRPPYPTITAKGDAAIVTPVIARIGQTGGNGAYVTNRLLKPLTTVTTKAEHLS